MRFWKSNRSAPRRCSCCGAPIDGIPTDFAVGPPWRLSGATDADFAQRVRRTRDTCVVDDEAFFIRGNIDLPILGTDKSFAWGVWCSLSRQSFEDVLARWDAPDRERDAPHFGWLYADLPGYTAPTWLLKTMVHQRGGNLTPYVEIQPGSHQIADEQTRGITVERWHQIAAAALARLK